MTTETVASIAEALQSIDSIDEVLARRAQFSGTDDELEQYRAYAAETASASDAAGRRGRAIALWVLGRTADAREALVDVKSDGVTEFLNGYCAADHGDAKAAAKHFAAARTAGGDHPAITCAEAKLDYAAGDLDGAEGQVKKLKTAEALALRGEIAERRGDTATAIELYEKALEADPEQPSAQFHIAYYTDLHGEDESAFEAYRQLARRAPLRVNTMINLGLTYEDREEYHRAIECYDMVLMHDPTHDRARLYLKDARASLTMHYDEDLERREDKRAQLLGTPISEFELSVRSRNCLARMHIDTLGDLIQKTEPELLSYKNFGETSLQEIKNILGSKSLRLGMSTEEAARIGEPGMDGFDEQDEVLVRPVTDLNLPVRVRKGLEKLGVATVGDLVMKSERELTRLKNFGKMSLTELKKKLADLGLALAE